MSDEAQQWMELRTWTRLHTFGIVIEPQLIGRSHDFVFEGERVNVALPNLKMVDRPSTHDPVATCQHWQNTPHGKVPVEYAVLKVDVRVTIPHKVLLPDAVLKRPCNAFDVISAEQQASLDNEAGRYGAIGKRAHAYWLDILRWSLKDGAVARPEPQTTKTGWSTYMETCETGHRVWGETVIVRLSASPRVQLAHWRAMERRLVSGEQVPAPWVYLLEAQYLSEVGDWRRGTIDAAVALEAFLRTRLERALPAQLDAHWRALLQRSRISELLGGKTLSAIVGDQVLEQVGTESLASLRRLVERRNVIMHGGALSAASHDELREELSDVQLLFAACE